MSGINGLPPTVGNTYIQPAEKTPAEDKNIKGSHSSPLPEAPEKSGSPSDLGVMPDAPSGDMNVQALGGFVASLSPGAVLAALCVKEAAKQNEENVTELMKRSESVQENMRKQADNIESGAKMQMIMNIVGASASALGSIAGTVVGVRGTGDALKINQTKGQGISQVGSSIGSILSAVGTYLNAEQEAENKRLEAENSMNNTAMETIRTSMQAQRDLINQSIEFMNSMQASRNQTLNRILG